MEGERRSLQSSHPVLPRTLRNEAGHDEHDEPARTEDRGVHTPEAWGRGAGTGVSQEAVTTAVLNFLSNPDAIRRLLAVISPDGGLGSASSTPTADGKLSLFKYGSLVPVS